MTSAAGKLDVDVSGLARSLRDTVHGTVAFDVGTRALYTADASNYRHVPLGVVVPRTVDDVVAAVSACREFGVPVINRGGGTSVAGNSSGDGLVIDASRQLTAITALDPANRTATVEPGLVLDDLRAAVSPHGLTFGPDPSTHSRCTLGGMIGNNACGSHSVAWGTTADNVRSLDVLLADGTRLTVGATSRERLAELSSQPSREGKLYANVEAFVQRYLADIRTGMPHFPRRVSGYALDQLLPENGFHLARALTGTEGTCVTVLGATVDLVPVPAARSLVVLGYPSTPDAADAVPDVLSHQPLTVEGIDERLVSALGSTGRRTRPPLPAGRAWLLIEVGGEDADESAHRARRLRNACGGLGRCIGTSLITDPSRQRALWRIREDGAGLATRLPDGSEAWPGLEDAAVPPERLGSYLRGFDALMDKYRHQGLLYGHFGEGCLHVRIDFDLADKPRFRAFMEEAADLIVGHGGSLSGEHGDGQARSELLSRMYSPELCRAFEEFKAIWDPGDLMNPGIIVRPAGVDENLRVPSLPVGGLGRDSLTLFSYPHDEGSIGKAVSRCVGVGKCRRSDGPGVMCPSYMVTKEEKHSTRGRARLLFEMLAGDVLTDGWRSTEVRDALDLCLSCKGCRSDCPVDVDMATYKAEFLHHHYAKRIRPASHYSMGWLPLHARVAGLAPRAVNAITGRRSLAKLMKRVGGIAPERDLPIFARRPFTRWFRHRSDSIDPGRPTVVLWPDTFNNYFSPQVARAATEVLEAAGLRVILPRGSVCCGLTWVSTGQLGVAKKVMRRSLSVLQPYLERGLPVVGLEPSCTAALRTDLPELLPGAASARLAAGVYTFAEALQRFAPDWKPPRLDLSAITQVHCHQHAVLGFDADESVLEAAGVDNASLNSGCCGLAGNFGFERGHYDVSKACGERVLLPAVRAAEPDELVIADGFSCRTQIEQETPRRAIHLAEVLRAAMEHQVIDQGCASNNNGCDAL